MASQKPLVLMIAGFGDNASMYAPLLDTDLAEQLDLQPVDLPGFGAPPLKSPATLGTLGDWLANKAQATNAHVVIAHSVASIIASLAAARSEAGIRKIVSLEGNLTAKDAYFSGRAAEHGDPQSFRDWFLPKLRARAQDDPILSRYASEVEKADPQALWELGCDARRVSDTQHPGEILQSSADVTYVLNRSNCDQMSLDWLDNSGMACIELPGASHWPTIDQPEKLAEAIESALS